MRMGWSPLTCLSKGTHCLAWLSVAMSVRDRILLWGRSGNRCPFPDCRRPLTREAEETKRDTNLSQEAHIVADCDEGPRGASSMTKKQRDAYPNRVLLCLEHHKIVDDDPDYWTVDRLLEMKAKHEAWVESVTSAEEDSALAAALIYAEVIQRVGAELDFDSWHAWSSTLVEPTPSIHPKMLERIERLREWLFRRPWPQTLPELEEAFENLRRILDDLAMVCRLGLEEKFGRRILVPEYKKRWVENYDEHADQFEWTVDVIHDLMMELTRAANLVCDRIRKRIDPLYRADEGVLVVERMGDGLHFNRIRPTYSATDLGNLYPGLGKFLEARSTRDIVYGEGRNERGWRSITPFHIGE
jgi:hypothetical protein